MTAKNKRVETESKKCPNCGANMVFNPETQKLYCPHCGSEKSLGVTKNAEELNLSEDFSKDKDWARSGASLFRCANCGAEVVLAEGETAKSCPFCGTAHVEKTDDLAGIKPNAVLPFSFSDEKAIDFGKTWAKKRFFAPKKFKKNISADNVKGVYFPCFTFDSHTTSSYYGRIGETKTTGSGKNTKSHVVWRNIRGTYYFNFDDLIITAGSKIHQKEIDKISPFDTNCSLSYDEKFMLGFMAYHYDDGLIECWGQAKDKIDAVLRKKILGQYAHDVVDFLNVSTTHENVTYKYVMLPVYIGNYKYNKKHYNFFVNGNSGKVYGKTPISALKVLLTTVFGIGFLVFLFFLISFFQTL